jgi:hypothetical protein
MDWKSNTGVGITCQIQAIILAYKATFISKAVNFSDPNAAL